MGRGHIEVDGVGPGAVPRQRDGLHAGRVVPRAQVAEAHTAVFVELLARHTLLLLRLRRETQRRTTHETRARGAESSNTNTPALLLLIYYLYITYTTYILLILLIYYLYYYGVLQHQHTRPESL